MSATYANIFPIAPADGILYANATVLAATEVDLFNLGAGVVRDPVGSYGAIECEVHLSVMGAPAVNNTYIVIQTAVGDNTHWVDVAWLTWTATTGTLEAILSGGINAANSFQQTRVGSPSTSVGSNPIPLGGKFRIIGAAQLVGGTGAAVTATISYRLFIPGGATGGVASGGSITPPPPLLMPRTRLAPGGIRQYVTVLGPTIGGTSYPYPDFVSTPDGFLLPPWMDVFNPPLGAAPAGPGIATFTWQAQPANCLAIYGDAFASDNYFVWYGQTTIGNATTVNDAAQTYNLRLAGNQMIAQVPASLPVNGAYLAIPKNSAGAGKSVLINRTNAEWVQSYDTGTNTCQAGSVVGIFGSNLTHVVRSATSRAIPGSFPTTVAFTVASGLTITNGANVFIKNDSGGYSMRGTVTSYVGTTLTTSITSAIGTGTFAQWSIYLVDQVLIRLYPVLGGPGTTIVPDYAGPYEIKFTVPSLTAGDYYVMVHNGMGGSLGWSLCPDRLTVGTAASIGIGFGAYANVLSSFSQGAPNTPANDVKVALALADADIGTHGGIGTIAMVAGTYYMKSVGYTFTNKVRLVGAGKTLTTIQTASGFSDTYVLSTGANQGKFDNWKLDTTQGGTFSGNAIGFAILFATIFDNMSFDTRNIPHMVIGIGLLNTLPGVVTNCDLTGAGHWISSQFLMDSCTYTNAQGVFSRSIGAPIFIQKYSRSSVTRNTMTDLNQSGGNDTIGSGRIIWGNLTQALDRLYVGENTCTPLKCQPDNNSGEKIAWDEGPDVMPTPAAVISATPNTITSNISQNLTIQFSNYTVASWIAANGANTLFMYLKSGKAAGEWALITSVSGNVFTLDRNLAIIPDNTSTVAIDIGVSRTIIFANNFSHLLGEPQNASCLLNRFCHTSFDFMTDGNTVTNGWNGIFSIADDYNTLDENCTFSNNDSKSIEYAKRFGLVNRNNTGNLVTGSSTSITISCWSVATGLDVFEAGSFTNGYNGMNIHDGSGGTIVLYNVSVNRNAATAGGAAIVNSVGATVSQLGTTAFTNY